MLDGLGGGTHGKINFERLTSLEHLFAAWDEFRRGKEKKIDVEHFALDLEDNLFALHERLVAGEYQHGGYQSFFVRDPKLRHIHKASVADRVLHHAVSKMLNPVFERGFIYDLYSNRQDKGTHRAFVRMQQLAWKLSRNNTKTVWALKCDVRKFFDNMDHDILLTLIRKKVDDPRVLELIRRIINSYETSPGRGLPLGNLTSQLFSNIYLDPLDQWMKREVRGKNYLRYVDDFLLLGLSRDALADMIPRIREYLADRLQVELHPKKIDLRAWYQGVDFLGYVGFPYHSVLRVKTAKRMLRKVLAGIVSKESLASYRGHMSHCCSYRLGARLLMCAHLHKTFENSRA